MPEHGRPCRVTAAAWAAWLLLGCGGSDRAAPDPAERTLAKPDTGSGDQQVAPAGTQLRQPLRVQVTRDGRPVAGAVVRWGTTEGSIAPATAPTDADGFSSARWTLQLLYAQQVAVATLDGDAATGVRFTAIATPDPADRHTVLVGVGGEQRFLPAEMTIMVGDTVNWFWPEGSEGHNVVPDAGGDPPQSGPLVGYPRSHSFRFEIPGVYHYHCMAHGAVGGVGMSGTITVVPDGPEPSRR